MGLIRIHKHYFDAHLDCFCANLCPWECSRTLLRSKVQPYWTSENNEWASMQLLDRISKPCLTSSTPSRDDLKMERRYLTISDAVKLGIETAKTSIMFCAWTPLKLNQTFPASTSLATLCNENCFTQKFWFCQLAECWYTPGKGELTEEQCWGFAWFLGQHN